MQVALSTAVRAHSPVSAASLAAMLLTEFPGSEMTQEEVLGAITEAEDALLLKGSPPKH